MVLLSLSACSAGDEDPGEREASQQDIIYSFLFGAGVQFLSGNVFNGQAQMQTCVGDTADALTYCAVTYPGLQAIINANVDPNVNVNVYVVGNQIQGVFNTVAPLRNATITSISFPVRGSVTPGVEDQQPILTLTQSATVTLSDPSQTAALSRFRAEMQPNQLVGSYDLDVAGSGTGTSRVTINFAAGKSL